MGRGKDENKILWSGGGGGVGDGLRGNVYPQVMSPNQKF